MNEVFRKHVEQLEPKFQLLLSAAPYQIASLPRGLPTSGVYLLSEADKPLYVGRSQRLRDRLKCHICGNFDAASLAFLLARLETGFTTTTKKGLKELPEFQDAFDRATQRIRNMEVRFVEESDPVRQALLEIYAAISLDTPYNDFGKRKAN